MDPRSTLPEPLHSDILLLTAALRAALVLPVPQRKLLSLLLPCKIGPLPPLWSGESLPPPRHNRADLPILRLKVLNPLYVQDEHGKYTDEILKIFNYKKEE